jgi:hypothetical protein
VETVKNYASHLLAKLGLQRRTQAAMLATEQRRDGEQPGSAESGSPAGDGQDLSPGSVRSGSVRDRLGSRAPSVAGSGCDDTALIVTAIEGRGPVVRGGTGPLARFGSGLRA